MLTKLFFPGKWVYLLACLLLVTGCGSSGVVTGGAGCNECSQPTVPTPVPVPPEVDDPPETDEDRCEAEGGSWRDATEEEIEAGIDIDGKACSDGDGGTIEL